MVGIMVVDRNMVAVRIMVVVRIMMAVRIMMMMVLSQVHRFMSAIVALVVADYTDGYDDNCVSLYHSNADMTCKTVPLTNTYETRTPLDTRH